jgi:cytochrome c oxidase assembly protein subunit 15
MNAATTVAVDLAPLAQMLLVGAMIAALALGWIWLRRRGQGAGSWTQKLTVLTLVLTFDLVVFGAFTRLSDSGLGCPDWPGCYGHASPMGAKAHIQAAESAMPSGPVTHGKAWIEMLHRYLATGVGALILVLAVASWRERGASARSALERWWPTLTLVWVCIQGAFGAWTVTLKLRPAIVTLHLLGGLFLLSLLCVQAQHHARRLGQASAVPLGASTVRLLWAVCALLLAQLALGGWVSTNYAVLACSDFPQCQGSWWPEMRFDQAFQVWRDLGMTGDGEPISFAALTAIHYTHRLMAVVVLVAIGWLVLRLRAVPALATQARWLGLLALLQLGSGLGNVILGWPLLAALLHTAGAAGMVVVLTWTVARTSAVVAGAPRSVHTATSGVSA